MREMYSETLQTRFLVCQVESDAKIRTVGDRSYGCYDDALAAALAAARALGGEDPELFSEPVDADKDGERRWYASVDAVGVRMHRVEVASTPDGWLTSGTRNLVLTPDLYLAVLRVPPLKQRPQQLSPVREEPRPAAASRDAKYADVVAELQRTLRKRKRE